VEVVCGDVRDRHSVAKALDGAGTVISAVHGFAGPGGVSPASVDRAGNAHLIGAAARAGCAFVLVSVVGAAPAHPIGLFQEKHAAEQMLRASCLPWTIVRATAFMETWGSIMSGMLTASGKILVFGRGNNRINFVSAADVAALIEQAVIDPGLRGQVLQIGGPANLTFNQVAGMVQEATGRAGTVRHVPRPVLHAISALAGAVKPALARQARAALAMDTLDMTFDPNPARQAFPGLPNTDMPAALKQLLTCRREAQQRDNPRTAPRRLDTQPSQEQAPGTRWSRG